MWVALAARRAGASLTFWHKDQIMTATSVRTISIEIPE